MRLMDEMLQVDNNFDIDCKSSLRKYAITTMV